MRFLPNALVYTRLVGFLWLNALLASTCFSLEFNYTAFPFRALTKLRKKEGDERKRFEMSIFVPVFDSKQSCCDGNPKDGNEVVGKRKRRRRKKRRSKLPLPPNYNSPQGGLFLITLITIKERWLAGWRGEERETREDDRAVQVHRLADDPNATKLCHEVELVSTRFITTSRPEEGSNQTNRIIKIRDYTLSPFFHYYRVQIKMKYLPFQSNFSFSISNKTPSTSPTTRPIFSFPLLSPIRPFIVLHSILHVAFSSRRSSNLFRKLEGFVHDSLI